MSALLCLTKSIQTKRRAEFKGGGERVRNSSYVAVLLENPWIRIECESVTCYFAFFLAFRVLPHELSSKIETKRDCSRSMSPYPCRGLGGVEHRAPGDCGMNLQEEAINWIRLRAQTHMVTILLLFFFLLFYSVTLNRK